MKNTQDKTLRQHLALPSKRRWCARQIRRRDRRLSREVAREESCESSLHGLDAARAHAHRAVGHPRVQPESQACFAGLAVGILAAEKLPPNASAWSKSIKSFQRDLKAMQALVANPKTDLYAPLPWGDGQTVLREALLVADHNAYHLGQLVTLRRLLGIWKE